MRLIDADALGTRMYYETFAKDSVDQRWDSGCWIRYRLFEKVLKEAPTVEQEQRTGKWIDISAFRNLAGDYSVQGCCSVCELYSSQTTHCSTMTYEYCPNCGAKMEVQDE